MKLTDRRLKTPPPLTITPAMMDVMREVARFNDEYATALAREIRLRGEEYPDLLRKQPTPSRRA